jgi:hypothetical protein
MADWIRDENIPHIGKIGRSRTTISLTPAAEATPDYDDGDVIGGKMTLSNLGRVLGGSGSLTSAAVYSKVDIGASIPIRVIVFNANPADSTFTENSAPSIHANDLAKIIGVIDLSQRLDLGTPVVLFAAPFELVFKLPDGADDAYAVAIAGGTINLGSTTDLTFVFGAVQD